VRHAGQQVPQLRADRFEDRDVRGNGDGEPLRTVRAHLRGQLAGPVKRGRGAGEHDLVVAVDVRQPGGMAFTGDPLGDLPYLALAQAGDGHHPVAGREQLGHPAGAVRYRGDGLAELERARGDGRAERADAVPGDDAGDRAPAGQRPGRGDPADQQRELRVDRAGERGGRVECGDPPVDQLARFGQRLAYLGHLRQLGQHPGCLRALPRVNERGGHRALTARGGTAHGSAQSRGPAAVRTSDGPRARRSSR
jgi:hypothetical protein